MSQRVYTGSPDNGNNWVYGPPPNLLPYGGEKRRRLGWLNTLSVRRHAKYCLAALVFFSLGFLFFSDLLASPLQPQEAEMGTQAPESIPQPPQAEDKNRLPPLFDDIYEYERLLPQHDETLPYPEGANGEYFYAANHVWGLGFNNALQELLFLSHLAYASGRSFVFDPYTWDATTQEPYSLYNGSLIPTRIPWNAFIAGPAVGDPFDEGGDHPRSVQKEYWRKICPSPTIISSNEVNDPIGEANVNVMMSAWVRKLQDMPVRCVEVNGYTKQIFDYHVFGDGRRVLPFLSSFLHSPIITRFAWSALVNSAVSANANLFVPNATFIERLLVNLHLKEPRVFDAADLSKPTRGLLAMHVRRGDFDEHCYKLAGWGSEYQGWLQHPDLPDRFIVPYGSGRVPPAQDALNYYMLHCWPTVEQMVAKIDEVRRSKEGRGLKRVYIMTNAPRDWIIAFKDRVKAMGDWEDVKSNKDLILTSGQKTIGQAIDMAIAMRAQVFIGNGFSSLSSNVVLLRLSRNHTTRTNRLW